MAAYQMLSVIHDSHLGVCCRRPQDGLDFVHESISCGIFFPVYPLSESQLTIPLTQLRVGEVIPRSVARTPTIDLMQVVPSQLGMGLVALLLKQSPPEKDGGKLNLLRTSVQLAYTMPKTRQYFKFI